MGRPKGSKNKKADSETIKELLESEVKITLKCLGRVYNSEGTFEEAIGKIKISGGANTLSIITVEKDGKTITKILNASQTNGVFGQGSPSFRAIHLKGVKQRLGL